MVLFKNIPRDLLPIRDAIPAHQIYGKGQERLGVHMALRASLPNPADGDLVRWFKSPDWSALGEGAGLQVG